MTDPAPREYWDRRNDETDKSWQAFQMYRDAGVGRTARQVGEALGYHTKGMVTKWSVRYDWPDRAHAYDAHLDRIKQRVDADAVVAMARRHAAIGATALAKAYEAILGINPSRLRPRDAIALAEFGAKLERLARGEATELHDHRGDLFKIAGSQLLGAIRANPAIIDLAAALEDVIDLQS